MPDKVKVRKVPLPPSGVGRYERKPLPEHLEIISKLRTDPGAWFEIAQFSTKSAASRYAANIKHNRFIAFRSGKFDATVRGLTVHARVADEG